MTPIFQSLHFFSRHGFKLTILFMFASVPVEAVNFYLHQSLQGRGEWIFGGADLLTNAFIMPLATGAAIYFIASRDQGGALSLFDSFYKSIDIYFRLTTSYLLVVSIVLFGITLYVLPGLYMLYKLVFVEFRIAIKNEPVWEAARKSITQTNGKVALLLLPLSIVFTLLLGSQLLIEYFLSSEDNLLILRLLAGLFESPFMAFSVVVGYRLFSLTTD